MGPFTKLAANQAYRRLTPEFGALLGCDHQIQALTALFIGQLQGKPFSTQAAVEGHGRPEVEPSEGAKVTPVAGVPVKERESVDYENTPFSHETSGIKSTIAPQKEDAQSANPKEEATAIRSRRTGGKPPPISLEGVRVIVGQGAAEKGRVAVPEGLLADSRQPWDHVVPQFFTLDGTREGSWREIRRVPGKGAPYDSADLGGRRMRALLRNVHDEIQARPYKGAVPLPPALEGSTVLIQRCGAGRDVFAAAQLVGREGRVIGIESSEHELSVARKWEKWQATRFGYGEPNTEFTSSELEQLDAGSVDVILCSTLQGLGADRGYGLEQALRLLKPGGELFFTDVFTDRRVPLTVQEGSWDMLDPATYIGDFKRMTQEMDTHSWGIVRQITTQKRQSLRDERYDMHDYGLRRKLGDCAPYSVTVRVIKLPEGEAEDAPEDFGQVATYNGQIKNFETSFALDLSRAFKAKTPTPVDGTTAAMLQRSRYSQYFTVSEAGEHLGPFLKWAWMQGLPKAEVAEMELQDHLAAAAGSDEPRTFSRIIECNLGYANSLSDPY